MAPDLRDPEAMELAELNIPLDDKDKYGIEYLAGYNAGKKAAEETVEKARSTRGLIRRQSSIFSIRDGHTLEFENIFLSTKSKNPKKHPPKQILNGISGKFAPKTLNAVMGKSGSGKTSLIKILTGRIGGGGSSKLELDGEIRLDHMAVDPTDIEVRRGIAYVEQDVSIPATCTPREAITFSARLRLDKSLSNSEINDLVIDILGNLGLQSCADTLIGGGVVIRMSGGLSGGEKKTSPMWCGIGDES